MGVVRYIYQRWKHFSDSFYRGPSWVWRKTAHSAKYISPSFMLFLWCHGLVNRLFTFQGWMLFWVCLATAFYATIMVRSAVTVLFLVIAGLFLVNGIVLWTLCPRLKVIRKVPDHAIPGRPFYIEYEIENLSCFPCFSILVDPLLQGGGLHGDDPEFFHLPGKGKICCRRRFFLEKRGVVELPAATVESIFPFGLLKASFCDHRKCVIRVHPVWRKWEQTAGEDYGMENGTGKNSIVKKTFQRGMELASCREYVYGDDIRYIHWGNSAKWGHLVVKEFEEEKSCRMTVILDSMEKYSRKALKKDLAKILRLQSFSFGNTEERFETVLSFASSLAASFATEENHVTFYIPEMEEDTENEIKPEKRIKRFFRKWIPGKESWMEEGVIREYCVGNQHISFAAFLNILSAAEKVNRKDRFQWFTRSQLQNMAEESFVLLVLLKRDEEAEKFYRKLLKKGVFCRVLYVAEEGEEDKALSSFPVEKFGKNALLEGKWIRRKKR
ncbi:MAG: DUF58 domain-containing protein [Lentisphaeria bacterium]|nr:DUF58 domain-containing protein [Lentisphaeria bacterium]